MPTLKPPAIQRTYDVCVIGSQLGGALAGALLARRGYRVLHVDHDGVRAHYLDGGYLLPHAPALLLAPRLFPAAEHALVELGLATDVARVLEPCAPDLQLLLPRHRVDLVHDAARRLPELKREWPRDVDALERAFAELARVFDAATGFLRTMPPLPAAGFGDRRAMSKAMRAAGSGGAPVDVETAAPFAGLEGHPLVSALRIARSFVTHLDGDASPFSTSRLLGALFRGTHRLPTGYEGLRDLVRRKIAESRGEVLGTEAAPAIADHLEVDGSRVHAVRIEGSPNAWVARVFIAATDAPAVIRMLPDYEKTGKTAMVLQGVDTVRQLLTMNLVVNQAALPPALGESVLALRDPAGGDGVDNAVFIQVLPARKDKGKGSSEPVPGERVVCAAGFVPASVRAGPDDHTGALGRRIRDAVADAIPFFERHVMHESMPAAAAPAELRGSRLMPHPLYAVEGERTLGVTGLPCRSPYRNLLFAGREVVPGLGLEGEFHAGLQAADAATDLLGKKDRLR